MERTKNILHISPDFNYSCGVSKYVFSLLKNFGQDQAYKIFFITNGGDSLDRVSDLNVKLTVINFSKGLKNIFNFYPNFRTLRRFCIQNNIDIIHTHHRYPEFLAHLVTKGTNIKTVSTVHSLVRGKGIFSFNSDKIIAVSCVVKIMLDDYYKIPSEKIIMLHNYLEFPDLKEQQIDFDIKSKLNIPEDGKIILFLGRITRIKGVDLLIEAFKLLRQKNGKIFLLIIGQVYDNSLKSVLRNLPDEIKLLAPVKNPYPYYSVADLVVLPSRIDPFPYVMLETGIMNKPFLGAKTGGIEEFIEDGINGILFEPGNVMELNNKIEYMINNQEKTQIMAENLFKKVKERMSKEKYIDQLTHIYDELLMAK